MKKEVLTISQRGEMAEQMKSAKHFYLDLKLFNEHFPASKMSVKFTKVNEHNMDSLHGQMLYELLNKVDQDDILNNRMTPLELANKKKADIKAAKEAEKQAKEDAASAAAAEQIAQDAADAKIKEDQEKALAESELNGVKTVTIVAPETPVTEETPVIDTVVDNVPAVPTIETPDAEKKSDLNKPNSQE